jgi:hypothetical protein
MPFGRIDLMQQTSPALQSAVSSHTAPTPAQVKPTLSTHVLASVSG